MSVGYLHLFAEPEAITNEYMDMSLVLQDLSDYILYDGTLSRIFFSKLPGDPPGPLIPMVPVEGNPRLYEVEDMRLFEVEDNRIFIA